MVKSRLNCPVSEYVLPHLLPIHGTTSERAKIKRPRREFMFWAVAAAVLNSLRLRRSLNEILWRVWALNISWLLCHRWRMRVRKIHVHVHRLYSHVVLAYTYARGHALSAVYVFVSRIEGRAENRKRSTIPLTRVHHDTCIQCHDIQNDFSIARSTVWIII